jgi:F-type H+-transporting ATPase subunit alpha
MATDSFFRDDARPLTTLLDRTCAALADVRAAAAPEVAVREVGVVTSVGEGIAQVAGLPSAQSEELLQCRSGERGWAFNLDPDSIGLVLLDESDQLEAGTEVQRTGRVLDVPVGEGLLGRVVDPLGRPRDGTGPVSGDERWPVERDATPIMARAPVRTPLQTGLKVVDALLPIGRGQRELILGDRQTGKTALAVDALLNQRDTGVVGVYCAVGQRSAAVAGVIADLEDHGVLDDTIVVVAGGDDPPGLQFAAPYAATSMAEWFMENGRDVLIVYDDLTRHAQAYRQLSLLLRRPPGREAYPGDIFYVHSRLLERATHLRDAHGGGSLTALPIVETEAQNLSAYIPTNLISITDGQIVLSPDRVQKGILPAVDVGRSVSRVGGKAQLPAYRAVTGELRLTYAQFQELEAFARFGTRLDADTQQTLRRGRRLREVLTQDQYAPMPVAEQIAVLLAATEGVFDPVAPEQVAAAERAVRAAVGEEAPRIAAAIRDGEPLDDEARHRLLEVVRAAVQPLVEDTAEAPDEG